MKISFWLVAAIAGLVIAAGAQEQGPSARSLAEHQTRERQEQAELLRGQRRKLKDAIDYEDGYFERQMRENCVEFERRLQNDRKNFNSSLLGRPREQSKGLRREFSEKQRQERLAFDGEQRSRRRRFYDAERLKIDELSKLEKEEKRLLGEHQRGEREALQRDARARQHS